MYIIQIFLAQQIAKAPQEILAVRRVVQVAGVGLRLRCLLGRTPGVNQRFDVENLGKSRGNQAGFHSGWHRLAKLGVCGQE